MNIKRFICRTLFLSLVVPLGAAHLQAVDQTFAWLDQYGTIYPDYGTDIVANGNTIYVTGTTGGNLQGINAGVYDVYVRRYDAAGAVQWTSQWGTNQLDNCRDVATDSSGNVYIAGYTEGQFPGETSYAGIDAFVSKFNSSGVHQWTRQLGGNGPDQSNGVAVDVAGNVYIAGRTSSLLGATQQGVDAFLTKYDSAGALQWTKQIGSNMTDDAQEVVVDSDGDIYITGLTNGNLGGTHFGDVDAFVMKYNSNGDLQWKNQIGGIYAEVGYDLALDGLGSVFITGQTNWYFATTTSAGQRDGFVSKFDAATGVAHWVSQFGGTNSDIPSSIAADSSGNVFIGGTTWGVLEGSSFGDYDAFLGKIDPSTGVPEWLDQFGTSGKDEVFGVATDGWGNLLFTGYTFGTLGESRVGGYDAFTGKIGDAVPEPSSILMLVLGLATMAVFRRSRPF